MSRIRTFLIGRHQDCDLRLDDDSVSRRHAEVVLTGDGHYFITDRASTGGTFVLDGSGWRPIHQEFVGPTDRLKFGDQELAGSRLESLRALMSGGHAAAAGSMAAEAGNAARGAAPAKVHQAIDDKLDPGRGLARDPETGEIIEQS